MTLFTAEGLLRASTPHQARGTTQGPVEVDVADPDLGGPFRKARKRVRELLLADAKPNGETVELLKTADAQREAWKRTAHTAGAPSVPADLPALVGAAAELQADLRQLSQVPRRGVRA